MCDLCGYSGGTDQLKELRELAAVVAQKITAIEKLMDRETVGNVREWSKGVVEKRRT